MKFLRNLKAQVNPSTIIIMVVAIFIAGLLLPTAMSSFKAANYTGLDSAVITIFTVLLPIVIGVGIALKFLHKSG